MAAIDCTHIKIQSPGGPDAVIFINRKEYFSLNMQAAVDSSYKFMNLVARWPGSIHDSTIFNNSLLQGCFERNDYPNCFLLGKNLLLSCEIINFILRVIVDVRYVTTNAVMCVNSHITGIL